MSTLEELLNAPLPSKANEPYEESGEDEVSLLDEFLEGGDDDLDIDKEMDAAMKDFKEGENFDDDELDEGCGDVELEDFDLGDDMEDIDSALLDTDGDGDVDDDDIDGTLDELEGELNMDGDLPDEDIPYRIPNAVDDPTPAEPLRADDDEEADHDMGVVATPIMLDETLTTEEAHQFVESGEGDIAVAEGLMLEYDLSEMASTLSQAFEEGAFASPNQKFKMTKAARFKQLYQISLQIEARAHKDPYYPRLMKAYAIERKIKKGWNARYGSLAKKRAMKYLKRLQMSHSPSLKKVASRLRK